MDARNYEIKNKNLHLVKADKDNFWPLMDLLNCMYEYEPSLIILKSGSLRESLL